MNTPFNGERLKKARIYRGLTVAELAERVGCQRQTLSMYEISKSQPTDKTTVARLAQELDFPVRYFYLDKYGILHVSKWEDIASKYGAGKYLVTDERLINSIPLAVTGADKEKLYFGKTKEPYSYIFGKTHDNDYCKFLAGVYMELENA